MNPYGQLAKAYWETYRPQATREMGSPAEQKAFFTQIGKDVVQQIGETFEDLADEATPGADFRDRIGELNMGRMRAREQALQELIYNNPKEPGTEDLDMPLVALPKIAVTLE